MCRKVSQSFATKPIRIRIGFFIFAFDFRIRFFGSVLSHIPREMRMQKRNFVLAGLLFFSARSFAQQPSTWQSVQQRILNRHCIGCHAVGGYPPAIQTGLLLTADSAYRKLIEVPPYNSAARADSLVRVSTIGGLPGLAKSYFWHKVNAPNAQNIPQGYGSIMPLGLPFLTMGELAFVNRWISGGAPETGVVAGADTNLFNDTTRFVLNFEPLTPPSQGFQLHLGPFNIWSSATNDREFLFFQSYPTPRNIYIRRYQIRYRLGSHHFLLYNYPIGTGQPTPHTYRDIRDSLGNYLPAIYELGGLFPTRTIVETQTPEVDYSFPPGVALQMPPGTGFDFNVHSVNRSGATRQGEVYVNLHTIDSAAVLYKATPRSFSNTNIFLPPLQTTTITRTMRFTQNTNIVQLWAHSHQRMIEFKVLGVGGAHNGELLYYTNDWEHPALLTLTTPLRFLAGDSLRMITTWHNPTSQAIQYGLRSVDEMQLLFYIAYGDSPTDVNEVSQSTPQEFSLQQNYPNPFNPTSEIRYQISEVSRVSLKVFDVLGREVATLVHETLRPGTYEVQFDAANLASGIYFYRLQAGEFTATKRMLLLR